MSQNVFQLGSNQGHQIAWFGPLEAGKSVKKYMFTVPLTSNLKIDEFEHVWSHSRDGWDPAEDQISKNQMDLHDLL